MLRNTIKTLLHRSKEQLWLVLLSRDHEFIVLLSWDNKDHSHGNSIVYLVISRKQKGSFYEIIYHKKTLVPVTVTFHWSGQAVWYRQTSSTLVNVSKLDFKEWIFLVVLYIRLLYFKVGNVLKKKRKSPGTSQAWDTVHISLFTISLFPPANICEVLAWKFAKL